MEESRRSPNSEITCPDCGSAHVVRAGIRQGVQRYQCRGCDSWFRAGGRAKGRRVPADQVGAAIALHYSGSTYREIRDHLSDAGISPPSQATISAWVLDYTRTAVQAAAKCPAPAGGRWVAAVTQVSVGRGTYWVWDVLDMDTGCLLASHLSRARDEASARAALEAAVAASAGPPRTITSADRPPFPAAVAAICPGVQHMRSPWAPGDALRQWVLDSMAPRNHILPSLGIRASAQRFLNGWAVDHNFGRGRQQDETPAEAVLRGWVYVARQAVAPPGDEEVRLIEAHARVRQWVTGHQDTISGYFSIATLRWRPVAESEVQGNPSRREVHPPARRERGARYYIMQMRDGTMAWVRISARWGELPPLPGAAQGRDLPANRRWELDDGRPDRGRTRRAGYLPIGDDGSLGPGPIRPGPVRRERLSDDAPVPPARGRIIEET